MMPLALITRYPVVQQPGGERVREWGWRMVSTGLAILAVLSVLAAVGYLIVGHDNGTDTTVVLPFFVTGIASALICAGLALVTHDAAQRKR